MQEIAKWHLTSFEAVPSSKFWKSEYGRTELTIVMKLCIHIDIDKSSPRDCQMSFGIDWGVAEVQILKNSETSPISSNVLNILIKLCINIAIDVS